MARIRHYFTVICKAFDLFYKECAGMFESRHYRILLLLQLISPISVSLALIFSAFTFRSVCSMRLIINKTLPEREQIMEGGKQVNHVTCRVFDFRNNEATE